MVVGYANIGGVTATDFIMTQHMARSRSVQDQDQKISGLVTRMVEEKRTYWEKTKVAPNQWPGPTLTLATPAPDGKIPRIWKVNLRGADSETSEILEQPEIRLEGSYDDVFSLLYGFEPEVLEGLANEAGVEKDRIWEALGNLKVLRPIDKLSLVSMPVQDAIDLAVFLAIVQVEMDCFLPGNPACGGPIDVMVLQMAPKPSIMSYPGKVLHHPRGP